MIWEKQIQQNSNIALLIPKSEARSNNILAIISLARRRWRRDRAPTYNRPTTLLLVSIPVLRLTGSGAV